MRQRLLALLIAFCSVCFCQIPADNSREFRALHVDASKSMGTIRSFQGVNGIPTPIMEGLPDLVDQYKELHIGTIRTHDTMGPTDIDARFSLDAPLLAWLVPGKEQRARLVQAGNAAALFPDWNANPDKPESYNFAPTDKFIQGIRATGAEVYYRIGRSWGADFTPLPDLDKFASVVKHVAMHYNQGWDNGFYEAIRYWEFWNEPETPFFWIDSPETFYALYEKTARALKTLDPSLKIGADAKAFAYDDGPFRDGLFDYCAQHHVPLDFYSWHHYTMSSADPYDFNRLAAETRSFLDRKGFPKAQSILSEWNLTPDFTEPELPRLQGIENAAFIGDALIYFQDASIDIAHFYRADAAWMGLFTLQGNYFKPAYAFLAAGKMLSTPQRLALSGADTFGFAALAGRSADGNTVQILISNYEIPANYKLRPMNAPENAVPKNIFVPDFSKFKSLPARKAIHYENNRGYHLVVENLPWGKAPFTVERYRLTASEDFRLVQKAPVTGGVFDQSSSLPPPALELIILHKQ
jgi:hypothetical protein